MSKFEPRIRKYLAVWQRRLRLLDWRIKLVVVPTGRASDDDGNTFMGRTMITPQFRSALIEISEPANATAERELEATVVHELLHLHLMPYEFGKDAVRDVMMEATIDQLSICFMKLMNPKWEDPRDNVVHRSSD